MFRWRRSRAVCTADWHACENAWTNDTAGIALGGSILFPGYTHATGTELYISDGTPAARSGSLYG